MKNVERLRAARDKGYFGKGFQRAVERTQSTQNFQQGAYPNSGVNTTRSIYQREAFSQTRWPRGFPARDFLHRRCHKGRGALFFDQGTDFAAPTALKGDYAQGHTGILAQAIILGIIRCSRRCAFSV